MKEVRNDKRSGGEINSPFFKTRKGLVVKNPKRTYPSTDILELLKTIQRRMLSLIIITFGVLLMTVEKEKMNLPTFFLLFLVALGTVQTLDLAAMRRSIESLRNGLLDNIDQAHLYLRIQKYALELDMAYQDIANARKAGSEEIEELEEKANEARAKFWTFLNNLRVNVVRHSYLSHHLKVLYGKSFKDYLAPVQQQPWKTFEVLSDLYI